MIDYVIYGKIIIDSIKLLDSRVVENQLGGGGPQGAFGARLWSDSVGLVSRLGKEFPETARNSLDHLNINTEGIQIYPELDTLYGSMIYDEDDYLDTENRNTSHGLNRLHITLAKLLEKNILLPDSYIRPKVFHLISEYVHEDMMLQAVQMKNQGVILSFEPLIDYKLWTNKMAIIDFLPQADIVSPDWPSASGFAMADDPKEVLKWWSRSGPACVSVRNGRHGSYVWDREHDKFYHIPIYEVPRIDPTGCGNSYAGAFCVGWNKYREARIAGAMGTVAATFMVQRPGIAEILPNMEREAGDILEMVMSNIREM